MANWLQGWDMNRHGSSASSGLTPPTEKQVVDATMMYALWMFPMSRMGQTVAGALVRAGAKRVVPPSGMSLAKRTLSMTPAGSLVQMGKGTLYRYLDHSNRDRTIISQSSERSSPSYQQSGSSGGKPGNQVSQVKPKYVGLSRQAGMRTRKSDWRCPPGYNLVKSKKGWICEPNEVILWASRYRK